MKSVMKKLSNLLLVLLCLHVTLILCRGGSTKHYSNNKQVALFIFGDSYFDSGNNNYINTTTLDQANFWPYGLTYFNFPTGRFSDGRLISDFIAQYAKLPLVPPFLQPGVHQYYHGVNFASAGAGALVETFQGEVISLKTQLKYYKKVETWLSQKLGKVKAKSKVSRAVYLFSIGTNDYLTLFLTNSTQLNSYSNSDYVHMVIANLTTVVKEIYVKGGRKFGFINLAMLGCFPGSRLIKPENNGSCLREASILTNLHNQALSKVLRRLAKQLKGFKYSLFDFNNSLRKRMSHPSKFGFKEGKSACCGTGQFRGVFSCGGKRIMKEYSLCKYPNEYVFWDSYHLTEKAYKQFAHHMWNGEDNFSSIGPYNIKDLLHAL